MQPASTTWVPMHHVSGCQCTTFLATSLSMHQPLSLSPTPPCCLPCCPLHQVSIRPGDTVVDVGANIGLFSMLAAEVCAACCSTACSQLRLCSLSHPYAFAQYKGEGEAHELCISAGAHAFTSTHAVIRARPCMAHEPNPNSRLAFDGCAYMHL